MELYTWDYGTEVPIKWRIEYADETDQMWVHSLRIWFVLSGRLGIRIGTRFFRLAADEVILVNPYEMFAVTEGGGTVAVYDLDLSQMKNGSANHFCFELNPQTAADESSMRVLKEMFARLVKFNENGGADNQFLNTSFYYAILHHLATFFRIEATDAHKKSRRHIERAEEIARYLDQNYTRPLSLEEVSEHFYLSVPYLSKVFKRYFGTTFTDYLADMRLASAMRMLSQSEQPLELVAEQCGLPNSRSLIANFKRKYGYTPGQFRVRGRAHLSASGAAPGRNEFPIRNDLSLFTKYLSNNAPMAAVNTGGITPQTEVPPCNAAAQGIKLFHTWKKLTSIGRARDILSGANQRILRIVQNEIGFEYIIFQGILDDDMMVYAEDANGQPDLNFFYVDEIIDFLLSIKLKPFIQLSFMPSALAKPDSRTMYYSRSVISMPRDMRKWRHLVRELIVHLNARYGKRAVADFPFTVWNCPDSDAELFGLDGGAEAYFKLYHAAFEAAREANPEVQFSGPSLLTPSAEGGVFLAQYLELCAAHNCLPSSIQYHFYPVSIDKAVVAPLQTSCFMKYNPSPDALRESIAAVRRRLFDLPGTISRLAITEWNATVSHRALLSDTAYQAAYIAKNILENYDTVDALCYWSLSDDIAEIRMSKDVYHGGMGLFTYNGIKKAAYEALRLLTRLGSRKLASGEGWFISRSDTGVQVILYNYQHFSELYSKGELFDMTFTNRYTPFPNKRGRRFKIPLTGLAAERYLCTETSLCAAYGSSFDIWLKSGAQPFRSDEDVEYLKAMSVPRVRKFITVPEDGELTLTCTLSPHELRVYELNETQEMDRQYS